jgi:hypothetical protein
MLSFITLNFLNWIARSTIGHFRWLVRLLWLQFRRNQRKKKRKPPTKINLKIRSD